MHVGEPHREPPASPRKLFGAGGWDGARILRHVVAVLALLQALAPGLASVADARAEANALARHIVPHVEVFGAKHPWRAHLDDCALCRLAGRQFASTHGGLDALIPGNAPRPLPAARTIGVRPNRWAIPSSRAPPAA